MSDIQCPFITEEECIQINQDRNIVETTTIQVGLILLDQEGKPVQFNKRKIIFPTSVSNQ